MCGRFNITSPADEIIKLFQLDQSNAGQSLAALPLFNITPGQELPIIRENNNRKLLTFARWGLVPHWSKEPKIKYATINARAETVAEKPAYRDPFKRQRCLIPANGFYEWQKSAQTKNPYHITMLDKQLFAFAGLWDHWSNEDESFYSCTIIVTTANQLMKPIHHRMPVILKPEDYEQWLDPDNDHPESLKDLLTPFNSALMQAYPIDSYVNSPKNVGSQCIQPL